MSSPFAMPLTPMVRSSPSVLVEDKSIYSSPLTVGFDDNTDHIKK